MKRILVLAALVSLPASLFAAGSGGDANDSPPKKTKTSKECPDGEIWDKASGKCVKAESHLFDDDTRYRAVRELAYAGRIHAAQRVLTTMSDQHADRVLTYWGFTSRKLGDDALATAYYEAAIRQNPDNLLARSYMAQGFVARGEIARARAELTQIRQRGGRNTWAEASLRLAIAGGREFDY